MNTPTNAQYRKQERHISNLIQATKFFVVDLGATDDEMMRLFASQLEFAHKMVELEASSWKPATLPFAPIAAAGEESS